MGRLDTDIDTDTTYQRGLQVLTSQLALLLLDVQTLHLHEMKDESKVTLLEHIHTEPSDPEMR